MSHILKMYYGIDVSIEEAGYFRYQGELYYFCFIEDITHFMNVYRYYRYMMHQCGSQGYTLVKNHNQDIISQNYILLIYHSGYFSFESYLQNFLQPFPLPKLKIMDIKEQWIQKIDCVREKVKEYAYSFKHDQDVISLIYYYCGIAENSINIINEILRIDQHASLCLSLSLSQPIKNYVYEILNPCYYIISSRPRQIVCLLRSQLLTYENIQELLESQYYDVYEIIYLYARIFYPSHFFDALLNGQINSALLQEFYQHLSQEREMYQQMQRILSFYVTLPKISWINDENMI
ncbi:hypothetical protein [Candidatus Stoquefichus massiliensis]|uniref:hypothetical protein n=1 Tax=Candidatus Stoquefichus massiliensis TaxID=1470350 RepID=UPI000486CD53|nr:hypothetical protein [Candidatus Stoquefichus massiliensis]